MSRVFIKPGSTTTEDSQRLEILDLGSRCNVLCRENKDADQRCGCHAADLLFVFRIYSYIKEKLLRELATNN